MENLVDNSMEKEVETGVMYLGMKHCRTLFVPDGKQE